MSELGIIQTHRFKSFGQNAALFTLRGAFVPLARNKYSVAKYWLNTETVYIQCVENELQFVEFEPGTELRVPRGVWHGFIFEKDGDNAEMASVCDQDCEMQIPYEFANELPEFTDRYIIECERGTVDEEPVLISNMLGVIKQSDAQMIDISNLVEGETAYLAIPRDLAECYALCVIEP